MVDPISWEFSYPYIGAALLAGYLLGSVPFGVLLTRASGIGDIRTIGSGNIGATNVLRTGKKGLAAGTLVLDTSKGALAAFLGSQFGPDMAVVCSFGALIGHLFPIWLRFRGGKGVATALGLVMFLTWPIAVCSLITWIIILAITRYSSLSALLASALCPVLAWYLSTPQITEFYLLMSLLIWFRHWGNIRRLISGNEAKIGTKK